VQPAAPAKKPASPRFQAPQVEYDETKPLVLKLDRLQARELGSLGGSRDKQDPALRITVGDAKPFNTER
jgi:hypothetical protein